MVDTLNNLTFLNFDIIKITKDGSYSFPLAYKEVKTIFLAKKDFSIIGSDNKKLLETLTNNEITKYSKMKHSPNRFNSNEKILERDKNTYMIGFGSYFKYLSKNDQFEKVWELNQYLFNYIKLVYKYEGMLEEFFKKIYSKLEKDSNIENVLKEKSRITHLFRISTHTSKSKNVEAI